MGIVSGAWGGIGGEESWEYKYKNKIMGIKINIFNTDCNGRLTPLGIMEATYIYITK